MRKKLANYGADTPLLDFADTASPADEIREAKTEPPPQPPPDMPRGSPPRRLSRHRQNKSSISKNKETTYRCGFLCKSPVHNLCISPVHKILSHQKRHIVGFRAHQATDTQAKCLDSTTATAKNGNGEPTFWDRVETLDSKLKTIASIVKSCGIIATAFVVLGFIIYALVATPKRENWVSLIAKLAGIQ